MDSTKPTAAKTLPSASGNVHFEELRLQIDKLSERELDALPVGMIQLDRDGKILRFNRSEGELARRDPKAQLGKSFFDDVAPCTKVQAFYGKFQEGLAAKKLYETFVYKFRFPWGDSDVAVTLFYSQATDSVWVLVSRHADAVAAATAQGKK